MARTLRVTVRSVEKMKRTSLLASLAWLVHNLPDAMGTQTLLNELRERANLSELKLAELLGTSLVCISRWQRGIGRPSPSQTQRLLDLYDSLLRGAAPKTRANPFLSKGVRTRSPGQGVLGEVAPNIMLADSPFPAVLSRLAIQDVFHEQGETALNKLLQTHSVAATTPALPFAMAVSAGKNTYTYDAHTYHTKVPPQGIAELLAYYLPDGGLTLDPFSGSGMTGVAASVTGLDCVLNELSPAACFISNRFTTRVSTADFEEAVRVIIAKLRDLRALLYRTECRECGREVELLYTVWSYKVICSDCGFEFLLWDHCKKFGRVVREHKILSEFPCPACSKVQRKSMLRRTVAVPVLVGYKCCGSKQQEVTHSPSKRDIERIEAFETSAPLAAGFCPSKPLPDGVNLRQPVKHGLDRIEKFYTRRNLSALSHLWQTIHYVTSPQLCGHLAFVFTSLYQRVTKLSEFRFWGGSGNMARFNVPFIFNEANVFITFERKARTILDHLASTAANFKGRVVVVNDSATSMSRIPGNSIDLIFTDPPFGANINYSEMNLLWESWLGKYTETMSEAIVNRVQGKGIREYERLMTQSLSQCYRVLRQGHWMLLVFMNSSSAVWEALRRAITFSGFRVVRTDIFDKQHGTFKQFVSENAAGMDLVLHCLKPTDILPIQPGNASRETGLDIEGFMKLRRGHLPTNVFLHVGRDEEIDYRTLYSEWLAQSFERQGEFVDFSAFRQIAERCLKKGGE
ncbi:MAG TPA: DNA methyltransferase [Terriglobia bacterium]|nr:DNA methyltransferase [Terriglobia bacterium]